MNLGPDVDLEDCKSSLNIGPFDPNNALQMFRDQIVCRRQRLRQSFKRPVFKVCSPKPRSLPLLIRLWQPSVKIVMWFCRLTSKKLGRCVCLASSITFVFTTTQLHPFLQPQQTVKRSDDTHEFCKYFDSSWILVSDSFLKIRRPVAGLDLVRPLFAWRYESLTLLSRCSLLLYPVLLQYLHSFKKLCETSLSCSSTLASFRYILTDWRPFKGARLNSPFSVSFLLITLECDLFIGRCLKRKEKQALEFGTSINGWVCFLAILCTKTTTNTFFFPIGLHCYTVTHHCFEVSLLHTLDGVYSLHARSHFTEARKT